MSAPSTTNPQTVATNGNSPHSLSSACSTWAVRPSDFQDSSEHAWRVTGAQAIEIAGRPVEPVET